MWRRGWGTHRPLGIYWKQPPHSNIVLGLSCDLHIPYSRAGLSFVIYSVNFFSFNSFFPLFSYVFLSPFSSVFNLTLKCKATCAEGVNINGQKVQHTEPVEYLMNSHSIQPYPSKRVDHPFPSCSWGTYGEINKNNKLVWDVIRN